jgi:Domain of unknown function (DUF4184)
MPFTISHIAAVLPAARWCKRSGQFSALAIGTMMPDLPYFLSPLAWHLHAHSLHSLLWWSGPIGALIWWLWHRFAKEALAHYLSAEARSRVAVRGNLCPMEISVLQAGLLCALGGFTHIAWDVFTHGNTYGAIWFPALRTPIPIWPGVAIACFHFLQIACSVVGLLFVARSAGDALVIDWWRWRAWWGLLAPTTRGALARWCIVPALLTSASALHALAYVPALPLDAIGFRILTSAIGGTLLVGGLIVCVHHRKSNTCGAVLSKNTRFLDDSKIYFSRRRYR